MHGNWITITLTAWLALNLLVIAWAVWRYQRLGRAYDHATSTLSEQLNLMDNDLREAKIDRIIVQSRERDLRGTLAIERSRVDHLIGTSESTVSPRAAARAGMPFTDFGAEPAGVRAVDDARRKIEERRTS